MSAEKKIIQADVVVPGSGPGGYTAAFRAADMYEGIITDLYPQ